MITGIVCFLIGFMAGYLMIFTGAIEVEPKSHQSND
jgi:F0F1-type ATP synthase assembly protein I